MLSDELRKRLREAINASIPQPDRRGIVFEQCRKSIDSCISLAGEFGYVIGCRIVTFSDGKETGNHGLHFYTQVFAPFNGVFHSFKESPWPAQDVPDQLSGFVAALCSVMESVGGGE